MTRPSDCLHDLTGDLHHLSTLIRVVTGLANEIIDPDKTQCEQTKKELSEVSDLLWIARDMAEAVAKNSDLVNHRVIAERNAAKKAVSI